ncbi:hypothetical protein LWI28_005170 [Acer negundo]|uniref:Uncharacterized protein n=1 Tax=Acer negundo TaxID=4023 RepID=A0AAD5IUT2_ACENE|nr:hypothetical protein LWI28_005170 [Acer negundo]
MDPPVEQMVNFNKGMTFFTSRVTESQVGEAEGTRVQEGDIDDVMKSNLQVMQATYEKLLNGFMEASQDRFSKLEKAVNRIDGHLGRIVNKLLSGKIGSSMDSFNLGSATAILRSGRIMKNGRNEEIMGESNSSPRKRKDEEKGIPVQEDIEGGRIQIPDEVETLNANPCNNKLPNPGVPKVPYLGRILLRHWNVEFFKLMGKSLGEVLMVDEQVLLRKRLEYVRVLVCLPMKSQVPKAVPIIEGNRSWPVSVEKDEV